MGTDKRLKEEAAGGRRITLTALYGILMTGALELGEIARMEVEIQKRGPSPGTVPSLPLLACAPHSPSDIRAAAAFRASLRPGYRSNSFVRICTIGRASTYKV